MRNRRYVIVWALTAGSLAFASDVLPPRLYDVTTETAMPHLEENLRYAIVHEKRCLAQPDSAPSLRACGRRASSLQIQNQR